MGEQEQSVAASPTVLPKFYFADSVQGNIYIFRGEFEDPISFLTIGSIQKDSVEISHSYISKIRTPLEKHIQEAGGRANIKATIAQKIIVRGKTINVFALPANENRDTSPRLT